MNIRSPVEPSTFLEHPNRFVIHTRLHGSGADSNDRTIVAGILGLLLSRCGEAGQGL